MAQLIDREDIESLRIDLTEISRSLRASLRRSFSSSYRNNSVSSLGNNTDGDDDVFDEESALQWAAIQRLPTYDRLRSILVDDNNNNNNKRVTDVTKLGSSERRLFIEKLIKDIERDNLHLLQKIRKRMLKVGIELPKVEVRYSNLRVETECEVVDGKPLPTVWNSFKSMLLDLARVPGLKSRMKKISILDGVSGTLKPGRMTLLLGPPGCGKTSFLKALSGNLNKSLKVSGEITYNGYKLTEFIPQKTSAYISQNDLHIPEMTVRETLDFSSRCQGVGSRADIMAELSRREKEAGILPDPDIDTYMKAIAIEGQRSTIQTDYILKILGLDGCANTIVGDVMRRGISGGQKKRLTTGEMMVGPTKALFMDEISNGLDSSTTYQIVACLQQLAHITDSTVLISLLQPAPETFDLFDDIILMAEGKIVYHGPRRNILEFFGSCGFKCPERKGIADFLQEVISRKDQAQYWSGSNETYNFISIDTLSKQFNESAYGMKPSEQISTPLLKSKSHKDAIALNVYSLPKWQLFKNCLSREYLLMKRNSFVYLFKSIQLCIVASIAMTVFLRTRMSIDLVGANLYMGALYYALVMILVDGFPEVSLTVARLAVFYKHRDLYFYPAWAYAIPSAILKIPLSLLASGIWTCLTYYVIGYSPEAGRFFRHFLMLFAIHLTSTSMFRFLASVSRTLVVSSVAGIVSLLLNFLFCGFIIPRDSMPGWLRWGFWVTPLTYGQIGLSINEFLAPRWQTLSSTNNIPIGQETLEARGLNFEGYFFWISVGALFGFTLLFNIGFILALSFLNPVGSRAIISNEKLSQTQTQTQTQTSNEFGNIADEEENSKDSSLDTVTQSHKGKMILPFEPLTLTFQSLQYYVETPMAMKERGFTQKKLQLLSDITGTFRPGILTALMGVSGAGKTTLLDVLAGRKTSGTVEGEIKVGGYPKVQKTFSRISGYCEQTDIHSPQITVEESVMFSAWLRLDPEIDSKTKSDFVKEVLETIELDVIKDSLVGIPGVSGLSTEQRKRLTISVELVANPSIIFLDEPTTGLDARAAAIVMRAVKNVANTGRTIVCTIHQPSIDIFEAFDEVVLMKFGGRMIYYGPLGQHSSKIIDYFEAIPGVPKIKNNYNPATWMLEVSSTSSEVILGVDFAEIYKNSDLHKYNKEQAKQLSSPPPGSKDLHFSSRFPQNSWGQFKACIWKQYLSYWRSPSYNLMRLMFMFISALILGALYWNQGQKINNQQSLFSILGSMFCAVLFCGINTASSVLPYVTTERIVFYRERFAGMYAHWAYPLAQVIIEIPYIFILTIAFSIITYPMIGYYWTAYKFFWYIYSMFCTILYFNYLGMMLIAITPSFSVAAILQSSFYTMFNLLAGFLIPRTRIPNWWIWLHYLTPTSWSLNALLTSQYGDIQREIEVFGERSTVREFLNDYFGFSRDRLPLVAGILILYPIVFACIFIYSIGKFKFLKR